MISPVTNMYVAIGVRAHNNSSEDCTCEGTRDCCVPDSDYPLTGLLPRNAQLAFLDSSAFAKGLRSFLGSLLLPYGFI